MRPGLPKKQSIATLNVIILTVMLRYRNKNNTIREETLLKLWNFATLRQEGMKIESDTRGRSRNFRRSS